jgi:hypothetical protein
MECDSVCKLLSGWMDGQLPPDEASAVEAHLTSCAECRSVAEAFRIQDGDLRAAFRPQRQTAQRVAGEVLSVLERESPVVVAAPVAFKWGSLLLAAAAGFLMAVVLFQPWRPRTIHSQPSVVSPASQQSAEPRVAKLVVATGSVQTRARDAVDWQALSDPTGFECASGTVVRTGPDVRCELKTSDGCVVRLNGDTEITLASPSGIEIQQGQIWCSSPDNVSLKICASPAAAPAKPVSAPAWIAACPSNSSLITAVKRDGDVQVMTSHGEAELQTSHDVQRLRSGENASIVDGQIIKSERSVDPLLAAGWIHTLLIRKGHDDEELAGRIDQLLAELGQSKVSFLYEQEIRGLGEHAAMPLLRFVQSPLSQDRPQQRLKAMLIFSDIAPSWMVPELIKLLADEDGDTRVLSANALQRLTGLNHGRPPEQWRAALADCATTIEQWQQWLARNRERYVRPSARLL